MRVYPVGYSLYGAAPLVEQLMLNPRMLLIDTRLMPTSWRLDWKAESLHVRYGERYRQAGAYLGNLNYRGGPIQLVKPRIGMRGLIMYLRESHDLILLCQCSIYEHCHRKAIVDLLLEQMPEVEVVLQEAQRKEIA